MSDDKETTNLSDLDEQLLNEAIVSTNGRDYTQEEIEHLALENELTPFQDLELEIHDELFESGLGWDKRAEWDNIYHPDDDKETKALLRLKRAVQPGGSDEPAARNDSRCGSHHRHRLGSQRI